MTSEARAAAELLVEKVSVEADALVYVTGPVPAGTLVLEDFHGPKVLTVPDEPGTYYVLFIDDGPNFKFHHPCRYAWVDLETGTVDTLDVSIYPDILRPGFDEPGEPFGLKAEGNVEGVRFLELSGDGAAVVHDVGPEGTTSPLEASLDAGPSGKEDEGTCNDPCIKLALVLDFGDENGDVYTGADDFSDDADAITPWIEQYGFTVARRSQYWENDDIDGLDGKDALGQLLEVDYPALFETPPTGDCCHEFFLYISSHGNEVEVEGEDIGSPSQLKLYDKSGDGEYDEIEYSSLAAWLKKLPSWVKITIFIDACYSGWAAEALKSVENGRCGLVIITASNKSRASWTSSAITDSATEDFIEAKDEDSDGDGHKGDIQDGVGRMKETSWYSKPQTYVSPEGAENWCSTDGPTGCHFPPPNPYCGDKLVNGNEPCDASSGTHKPCPDGEVCYECFCVSAGCLEDYECGDDDAGGTCGECEDGQRCEEHKCVCDDASCTGGCCDDQGACLPGTEQDGCGTDGGACVPCGETEVCDGGACVPIPCQPDCADKVCGDDGCEGSCGECGETEVCDGGACVPIPCQPDCEDKVCGDDGCGGECLPGCGEGWTCESGGCAPASNCCASQVTPGCNEPVCNSLICAFDLYCCEEEWDDICVDEATQLCEVCGGTCDTECDYVECGVGLCGGLCGECPGGMACIEETCAESPSSCCGWKLSPGCPDDPECEASVCGEFPECCTTEWFFNCGAYATYICDLCNGS